MTATAQSKAVGPVRRMLALVMTIYLLALGYVAWSPRPDAGTSAVDWALRVFRAVGLTVVTATEVEFALNVVMFVLLGFLGAIVFDRHGVMRWLAAGFAGSCLVEIVQWALLPGRSASVGDVIANTLGAGIGAALAMLVAWSQDHV